MEPIAVLDETIFEQINRGNAQVANAVLRLRRDGYQLWITNDLKIRLSSDADRRLIRDLNIQSPLQDAYADKPVMRRYVDRLPAGASQTAGALTIHLSNTQKVSAELMTADGTVRDTFNRYYGNVVRESTGFIRITGGSGPPIKPDYNQTRRLLRLKPLNILANGQIPPPPPKPPKPNPNAPPTATINGKVYVPNGTPVSTQLPSRARTVQQPKVATTTKLDDAKQPPKTGGGQVAAGRAAGVQLLINGIGFTLGWLAEKEQQRRFEADWAPKKKLIEEKMAKDPTQGALVFVYYSEMQGTRQFNYISYSFGRTEAEALQNMKKHNYARPVGAGTPVGDKVGWFPPSQPVDPHKLPTPFPAVALATFAGGRNRIMNVQWKGVSAFDETGGETKLDIPGGLEPLFLVLEPPGEMSFFNGSIRHNVKIEQYSEWAAETLVPTPLPFNTVDMDCQTAWVCGDTSAAMVYPAEEYTEVLFHKAPKIKDKLGQLRNYGLDEVRFVEPENIKIIEDFRLKPKKP